MKQLIIIGAGGMGRTIYDMAIENRGYQSDFVIKGFIDDNTHQLDNFENYPSIVGTISEYIPQEDDIFICSIGGESRRACMEMIINRGGDFITMIHPTSRIGTNVHIGKGSYIGAYTIIAADAYIDDYNFIQSHVIVGHDCKIGMWNRIDSYVMLVGATEIGTECMLHTRCMISHNVHIGNGVHVGAGSLVINDVENGTTVFGSPARRIK